MSARLLNNVGTVFFGSGFSKTLLIGAEIYCAFALGADGYGRFAIGFSVALVLATLAQCGLQFGIVRQLAIYQEQGDNTSTSASIWMSVSFVFLVSLSIGVFLISSAEWIADSLFTEEGLGTLLRLTGLLIVFEALNQILSAIFRGLRQFRKHVITFDLIRNMGFALCIPLGLARGISAADVFLLLLGGSIGGTIYGIVSLWAQRDEYRTSRADLHILGGLLRFSSPLVLWQVIQVTSNRLLVVLSAIFLGASQVGILALGSRVVNLLDFPQTVVNATTLVEFSRLYERSDQQATGRLYRVATAALLYFCALISLPIVLNSGYLMWWMGPGYEGYGWVITILLLAKLIEVGTGPAGKVIMAHGHLKALLWLSLFGAGLQFVGVLPLIAVWGLVGAVMGTAVRTVAFVAARHWFMIRRLGVNVFDRLYLRLGLTVAGAGVAGAAIKTALPGLGGALTGTIAGMVILLLVGWTTLAQHSDLFRSLPGTLMTRVRGNR